MLIGIELVQPPHRMLCLEVRTACMQVLNLVAHLAGKKPRLGEARGQLNGHVAHFLCREYRQNESDVLPV